MREGKGGGGGRERKKERKETELIGERRICGGHIKILFLSNGSVIVANLSHHTPTTIWIFRFWKNSGGFENKSTVWIT